MFFKSFTFFRGSPLFASAALVATGLAAGSASATAIKVLNSNFASPVEPSTGTTWSTVGTPTSPGSDTAIADWGVSAPTAGNVATGVQNYSPSIGQVCYGNGNGESTYNVYQDVGILQANTQYTLTVDIIANANGQLNGASAVIELVNTASDSNPNTQSATGTTLNSQTGTCNQTLTPITTSYTTGRTVSGDLSIELVMPQYGQSMYTNVGLTSSAVPEPASLGLMAIGALGLLLLKRRRTV